MLKKELPKQYDSNLAKIPLLDVTIHHLRTLPLPLLPSMTTFFAIFLQTSLKI